MKLRSYKLLSLLLAVILVFGLLPGKAAQAAPDAETPVFERYTGTTIEPGKYMLTAAGTGAGVGTWAWSNEMNGSNNMKGIKLDASASFDCATLDPADCESLIWEIDTASSLYTIKTTSLASNQYAYAAGGTSTSNYLRLFPDATTDTYRWTVTAGAAANTYQFKCADSTTVRNLLGFNYNSNNPALFSCYASGQVHDITLWKLVGEIGGGEPPVGPTPTVVTVAQARAMSAGGLVTITGDVTYTKYANTTAMLQDGTGANDGIALFMSGQNFTALAGKNVTVTGTLTDYRGLREIVPALITDVTDNGAATITTPKTVTLSELAGGDYIGSYIKVENVQLKAKATGSGVQSHTLEDEFGTSLILRANLSASAFNQGDWITFTGCGYYFDAVQLFCVDADITMGTAPVPPDLSLIDGSGTIAEWRSPSVGTGATSLNATGGDVLASELKIVGAQNDTLSWSSNGINHTGGFDGNKGDGNTVYWLIETSSKGFTNLTVSSGMRSSGTGPRDFKVQFATNLAGPWTDANSPAFTAGNAAWNSFENKRLPDGASDKNTLYIRFVLTSNTAPNGSAIGSSGTNQVNDIIITGDYLLEQDQLHRPASDTPSGAIALGREISFTQNISDAGATGYKFMVSTDSSTWNEAVGGKFTVNSLPMTIYVKASATGMIDSRVEMYEYTQLKMPYVTASQNFGAVMPGTTVRLENEISGAIIKYTINGGPEETYSTPITLADELFVGTPETLTIEAWAIMAGATDGDLSTFIYTKQVTGGEKVYFGQLHSHTTLSDGVGEVEEAYNYAKNTAHLDFFAVTDHSNSFDEPGSSADRAGTYNLGAYNAASLKWTRGQAAAAAALTNDFISIYGFEMTWSGGPGHMNTFATGGFVSRNNAELNGKTNDSGLRAYYSLLKDTPESISMFNHPGTTFGNFNNFAYHDPVIDQRVSLVEVGNGEGAIGSGGYFPSYEQYNLALDKGWHVAPANDQDNHKGKWGDSNTARTVIWTNDLSVSGLYQALRDRRVYSTEVADLEIVFKMNGLPLGTILDAVPASAEFTAEIINPTSGNTVKSVCLITNGGREIEKVTPGTRDYNYSQTIVSPVAGYYYLKVVVSTPFGDRIAVTAPVWLGSGRLAGFTEVTKSAVRPVTTEELTITASFYNNETKPVILQSIKYETQDGTVLANEATLNQTIATGGEYSNECKYVPTVTGDVTVTVTAVILFDDGETHTLTYDISYNVMNINDLVFLGIDGSHYNEYVSGNYADSMGNFTALAAENGVRVNVVKTKTDLIAALNNNKYVGFILTAPSRRLHQSPAQYLCYDNDELAAIATFAQGGGTLILTGWSNVYENYTGLASMPLDEHMSAQQNKILAAVGSTLRLADDAATDTTQCAASGTDSEFRLYLTDEKGSFNWESSLNGGVNTEQIYSQYGGSTVYAVDAADAGIFDATPAATLASSVVPAVTLSTNGASVNRETTNLGSNTNYQVYPKYDGKHLILASETVDHGGVTSQVIVAGGAFMSDFEVKIEMDYGGTLQYSNYNICLNLLDSLLPPPVITDIADVKTMPVGTEVTIEAIATTNVHDSQNIPTNTGFYDCIYAQDLTGGINLFPISSGVAEGQKIRVTGKISAYQDEIQIQVTKVRVISSMINKIAPEEMTPGNAMLPINTGKLIKVTGVVTEVLTESGVITQFTLKDADTGDEALIYINAYITSGVNLSFVKVGNTVSAVGLASIGENMSSAGFLPRVRVRDRNEITLISGDPGTPVNPVGPIIGDSPHVTINGKAVDAKVDSDGVLRLTYNASDIRNYADKTGVFKIVISGHENIVVNIPIEALGGDNLSIQTDFGTVTTPNETLQKLGLTNGGTLRLSIQKGGFKIALLNAAGQEVDYNDPNNPFTVSLPYTLGAGQTPNAVVAVNKEGKIIPMSVYKNGVVTIRITATGTYDTVYNKKSFPDIAGHWAEGNIDFVAARALFVGNEKGEFSPDDSMTRAMFAQVLANLDGADLSAYNTSSFKDVAVGQWYTAAVEWAAEKGIVRGVGDGNFYPNVAISREEMAVMLANYVGYKGYKLPAGNTNPFNDEGEISAWALEAVKTMQAAGIIAGKPGGFFDPKATATRAEVAAIFSRLIEAVA